MNTKEQIILKGASIGELQKIFESMGEPKFRAKQAFRRINKHMLTSIDEFSDFSKSLRDNLSQLDPLPRINIKSSKISVDGTQKYLLEIPALTSHSKPRFIEAVWIVAGQRNTLCISTQIGCTLNCTFCATGTLPFYGNLPAWVITEQVYEIARNRGLTPDNIVFMGMGEPFHNYENTIKAARILNHPDGLKIGAHHITISTAGVIASIEQYIRDKEPFNLAVSLNQCDTNKRQKIMDVNKKNPLDKLLKTLREYTKARDKKITFEYIMIDQVNMEPEDIQKLIKIGRSVRSKINLIPLNTNLAGMKRPNPDKAHEFYEKLLEAGLTVFNRGSPGRDINGACGMLALQK